MVKVTTFIFGLFMALSLVLQPSAATAQSDDEMRATRQRVHLTVQTLRDLVRPTDKRIGNTARALTQIGPSARAVLIDLAEDPVDAVRQAVLQALGQLQDPTVVPIFIQSLADRSPRVVIAAVRALRSHEGDWPTRALVRYLGHPDLVVRPYGWKGDVPTLRHFVRGASLDELGMESEEMVLKINRDRGTPLGFQSLQRRVTSSPQVPRRGGVGFAPCG